MMTTEKIDKVLEKLEELCKSEKEQAWLERVCEEAAEKPSDEKVAYLEGQLQALRDIKNEELEKEAEPQEETPVRLHTNWVMAALLAICVVVVIAFLVLGMFNGKHKANDVKAADSKTVSSLVLPKEEFQVIDYKVDGDTVVYNSSIANTQQKVFANGSKEDSLSTNANDAVNEMVQYMSHNATALKEKAMTFGIVDTNTDVKDWLAKGKDGNLYYNEKGKDVYYQTKAFLSRSQTSSKKMEEGSNYYATGVNSKGDVVVSENSQNLSGQEYVEVSNPKGSTEKYSYRVLVYCGNTVMQSNNIPGVKTGKVEIPTKPNEPGKPSEPGKPGKPGKPDKPGKPSEPGKPGKPDKPGESKVEKKDPAKDPANQGKAPVGGGKNDGSSNGSETSQESLPEQYSAPAAPAASAPAQSSTTPSQDARVSEPSQWSGAGTVTDSNGTTTVADNGAVTTPDNHHYDGLVGQSAPSVEAGGNGVTTPSSSANFAGGNSMDQPGIDD